MAISSSAVAVSPETRSLLRTHGDRLSAFVNVCSKFDSFEEYVEAIPDARDRTLDATRSLGWAIYEWPLDTATREQFLHGYMRMVEKYQWLAVGLQWAAGELEGQPTAA